MGRATIWPHGIQKLPKLTTWGTGAKAPCGWEHGAFLLCRAAVDPPHGLGLYAGHRDRGRRCLLVMNRAFARLFVIRECRPCPGPHRGRGDALLGTTATYCCSLQR